MEPLQPSIASRIERPETEECRRYCKQRVRCTEESSRSWPRCGLAMPTRFLARRCLPMRMHLQQPVDSLHTGPAVDSDGSASRKSQQDNLRDNRTWLPAVGIRFGGNSSTVLPVSTLLHSHSSSRRQHPLTRSPPSSSRSPLSGMDHTWARGGKGQIRFSNTADGPSGVERRNVQDPLATFAGTVRPALPLQPTGRSQSQARRVSYANTFGNTHDSGTNDEGHGEGATQNEAMTSSALDFTMPKETLEAALESQNTQDPQHWSYSMYQGPDGQKVTVHYCRKKEQSDNIAKHFLGQKILGFDLEWKMSLVKESSLKTPVPLKDRISLIQLATQDRIGLFHVAKFSGNDVDDLVPPTIKEIMEDGSITKAGVNIGNDCNRLRKYLDIDSKGLFELSHLHRLVKYAETHPRWVNRKLVSLATQVQDHLLLPLKKDDVRTSDWTLELKWDQIQYASSDVYASVHLFDVMDAKRRAMKHVPPLPHHWEKKLPIDFTAPESSTSEDSASAPEDDDAEDDPDIAPVPEDPDADISVNRGDINQAPVSPAPATQAQAPPPSKAPELILAESWVTEYTSRPAYQAKLKSMRPGFSELRAYALWQHHALDVADLARMLSVKDTTAASYVAATVSREGLPCEMERLHAVLECIPANVVQFRFARLFRDSRDAMAARSR